MLGYELVIDDEIASAKDHHHLHEPALIGDVIPSVGKDGGKGELMQSSTFASVFHLLLIISFSSHVLIIRQNCYFLQLLQSLANL